MKLELEKQLKEKYPLLFSDLHNKKVNMQQTCMVWGLECNDGWYQILDDLGSKLEPLIEKYRQEEIDENGEGNSEEPVFYPKALQVKEKFGSLRFYMTGETEEMSELISDAEDKSYKTCENCGKPSVEQTEGSWVYTLCQECRDDMQRRRDDQRAKAAALSGDGKAS